MRLGLDLPSMPSNTRGKVSGLDMGIQVINEGRGEVLFQRLEPIIAVAGDRDPTRLCELYGLL